MVTDTQAQSVCDCTCVEVSTESACCYCKHLLNVCVSVCVCPAFIPGGALGRFLQLLLMSVCGFSLCLTSIISHNHWQRFIKNKNNFQKQAQIKMPQFNYKTFISFDCFCSTRSVFGPFFEGS